MSGNELNDQYEVLRIKVENLIKLDEGGANLSPIDYKIIQYWEYTNKIIENKENPIDKAKRELHGYQDVLSKVWNEDLTDEQELLYLKFYRAGIKIGANQ